MNYLCIISDWFLTFTVDTEEYPLLKVHDFTFNAPKSYVYILQIGSFEKKC